MATTTLMSLLEQARQAERQANAAERDRRMSTAYQAWVIASGLYAEAGWLDDEARCNGRALHAIGL